MMAAPARYRLVAQGAGLAAQCLGPVPPTAQALLQDRSLARLRALLPVLFGLCRHVQETALALALSEAPPDPLALRRELIRDHLARLCLHLPAALGLPGRALPPGWAAAGRDDGEGRALVAALYGPAGQPAPADLPHWLASDQGLAPILGAIARAFAPGEAAADLPALDPQRPFAPGACDNSLLARQRAHPLVAAALASHGPGPLARALARLADLADLALGQAAPAQRLADGSAWVPCSRGICLLSLQLSPPGLGHGPDLIGADTQVIALQRRSPTDDILAPGGLMAASLAALPADRAGLAPLVLAVLDPCLALDLQPLSPTSSQGHHHA